MASHRLREVQEAEMSGGTEAPRSALGGEEWPGRQYPRLQQAGLWKGMGVGRVQQFGGFYVKMSRHSSWDTRTRAETSLAEQRLPPEHRWWGGRSAGHGQPRVRTQPQSRWWGQQTGHSSLRKVTEAQGAQQRQVSVQRLRGLQWLPRSLPALLRMEAQASGSCSHTAEKGTI